MKQRFLPLIIAAAALAGCAKDFSFSPAESSLKATIECGQDATKAILLDKPGVRLESRWTGGESISVFGAGSSNVKFDVAAANISEDGKTATFNSLAGVPSGELTAVSPYQTGAKASGNSIVIDIPATQTYATMNGVVQPDFVSNIMVGTGSKYSGLTFRNAMAVLKIGQVFDEETVVKKIEFRDLGGAAVSGAAEVSWNGGQPVVKVTGSGKTITLDCGEGVALAAGQKGVFFLIVPAKTYSKGFELTFIDDADNKTVKTVGTTKGKTLDRSIVYLIGDVSSREPLPGTSSALKETAQIVTPEKMDDITVTDSFNTYVYDENGRQMYRPDGTMVFMPHLSMTVPASMNPAEGNYLIFDEPTDDLPYGGVYYIKTCQKMNDDYYNIVAYPEINVAAPFEDLTAGDPLVDDSGEIIEDGGLPIDISSYISSIVDNQGQTVPFSISSSGDILLSEDTMLEMMGADTKSIKNDRFTSPRVSMNRKWDNVEVSVGGSIALDTRIAVRYMQGELQYMQFTVTPEIKISINTVLKAEDTVEASVRLYTINVLPIPVAPGVLVVPQIVLYAKAGVGGSLQVSAEFGITQKLGTYSLAYNRGDGATLRWLRAAIENAPDPFFNFGGFEGSLYAMAGLGVSTNITLYGMCGLGLENYLTFKLSTIVKDDNSRRLSLQPEFEVTPAVSFPFGSKRIEDLTGKVEFDPIWERYIYPGSKGSVIPSYHLSEKQYMISIGDVENLVTPVFTGITGLNYHFTLTGNCVEDFPVVLAIFKGDGIKYSNLADDPNGMILSMYKSAGVEHLYSLFHLCYESLLNPSKKPVSVIHLGTYPAGVEEKVFEGTAKGSFSSGVYYGVVPALKVGDEYYLLLNGNSNYNPFIYSWPNRLNGQPYDLDN